MKCPWQRKEKASLEWSCMIGGSWNWLEQWIRIRQGCMEKGSVRVCSLLVRYHLAEVRVYCRGFGGWLLWALGRGSEGVRVVRVVRWWRSAPTGRGYQKVHFSATLNASFTAGNSLMCGFRRDNSRLGSSWKGLRIAPREMGNDKFTGAHVMLSPNQLREAWLGALNLRVVLAVRQSLEHTMYGNMLRTPYVMEGAHRGDVIAWRQ